MRSFKILNYRTLLELLNGSDRPFYFALGNPLTAGGLRGTAVAIFHPDFLQRRMSFVDHWSPVDIGGVSAGLSKIGIENIDMLKQSVAELQLLLEVSQRDSALTNSIENHHSPPNPAHYFADEITGVLEKARSDSHTWLYEVALSSNLPLRRGELTGLRVPNTSKKDVQRILNNLGDVKISTFNPVFGISS